jgi:hypothetical protein
MKFKAIYTSMTLLLGAALFLNNASGPVGAGNGDRSGASGTTCNSCHSGTAAGNTNIRVTDTFGVVQTSYNPGQPYVVLISVSVPIPPPSTFGYGHNLRIRATNNTVDAGSMSLVPGASAVMRIQSNVLEHTQTIASNGIEVRWTAPAAGTDTVTFYGASIVGNSNGNNQNDLIPTPVQYKFPEAVASSVRQAVELSHFVVFPTQAESQINLRFAAAEAGQYTAEVVNVSGQVVSTQVFAANQGEQTQSVEINNLAAGTYFVRLRNHNNTIGTKAFIKF